MSGQPGGEGAPAAQRCGGRRRSIGPCDVAKRRARLFAAACCILVLAAAQLAAHASHALTPPPAIEAVHVVAPELPETRRLGEVVAADGDLLAISAPTDGDDALDPGRVMIMRLSLNARGTLEVHPDRTLFSHAPTAGDHFGASLAAKRRCADAGGADLVAVGADRANAGAGEGGDMRGDMTSDMTSGMTSDMASDMAGAVEVFERAVEGASWRLAARLSARTPEPAASFGAAIAFDQGGSARLVVGAPRHDAVGAFDAGRVHVFRRLTDSRDAGTGARWTEVATITPPSPRLSMWFGSAVAIKGDLLAIASPGDDVATAGSREPVHAAGAVYIYRRTAVAATGSERYRLERVLTAPSPEPAAWFGLSIDLDDGVLAVGAPRARDQASGLLPTGCVYLFDLALAEAMPKRIDPPSGVQTYGFGQSLALGDGVLVIGAPSTDLLKRSAPDGTLDDAGAAWTYTLGGARFTGALNPPKPLPSGLFGASCAIGAAHAPAPTRPDEPTDAVGLAIVGHRFVEEESIEPSRGAAIFVVPRGTEGVAIAPPHAAPP